jgi:hypothetical protein
MSILRRNAATVILRRNAATVILRGTPPLSS